MDYFQKQSIQIEKEIQAVFQRQALFHNLDKKMEVEMSNSSKWLRILVTDLKTGKSKANVRIPASLADFGIKMAVKFAPTNLEDLNMDQIMAAVKSGADGKLVDVEDEEKGEHVEIFVE